MVYEIISDGSNGPRTWAPFTMRFPVADEARLKSLFNELQVKNPVFVEAPPALGESIVQRVARSLTERYDLPIKKAPSALGESFVQKVARAFTERYELPVKEVHFELQNAKQVAGLMQAGFNPEPVTVNFEIS